MNQDVINYLNMLGGALSFLRQERTQWENETEIEETVTSIETDYLDILTHSKDIEGLVTTGLTDIKDVTFDLVMTKTLKICRKLSAYAKKKNDLAMLPLVNHSHSSLSRGPEKEAIARCKAILDAAAGKLQVLTTFKITLPEITAGKLLITNCENLVDTRTNTVSNRTVSGEEVAALVSATRKNLSILDDLIEGISEDEAFISRYLATRHTIDTGKGKTLKNKKVTPKEKTKE